MDISNKENTKMTKILMNQADLDIIQQIVKENDIKTNFWVHYSNASGIGYSLDLEYVTELNGREATVKIVVTDEENW
jgi:hypothetical protein